MVIYSHNVTLQIGFIPIDIPLVFGVGIVSVLHTDRRAVCIVEVDNYFIACNLGYELVAVIVISGNYAVFSFALPYAIVVVGESKGISVIRCACEPSTRPAKGCAVVVRQRVADLVIGYGVAVKGYEYVIYAVLKYLILSLNNASNSSREPFVIRFFWHTKYLILFGDLKIK